jgi:hypothetical protein
MKTKLLTLGLGEVSREEEHADPLTTPQPTSELTASQLIPNQLITSEQTASQLITNQLITSEQPTNELSSSSSQLPTPELPDLTDLLAPVQTLPRHDAVEVPSFAARGADIEVDGDESTPSYLGVQEDTRMGGSSPGVQVASVTTPLPSMQGTLHSYKDSGARLVLPSILSSMKNYRFRFFCLKLTTVNRSSFFNRFRRAR